MNILIVSQYYYPEQFQINEIAPELVKRGHDVTVLTGLPNYPTGIVSEDYKHGKKRNEVIYGVNVIRCFEIGRKKGKLNLLLNYASFALSASNKVKKLKEHFDVIISYQLSPITMVYPAILYKKKHKCPLILYCLDIWPESAQAHVSNNKGGLYKFISKISKEIYQKCDRILVTSSPFIDYLAEKNGIDKNKIGYLPQHANDEYLDMNLNAKDNDCTDFMYAGNLGCGQVIHNIILAATELRDRSDFKIHIVGDGSCADDLKKLALDKGVADKIIFYGNKPRSEMPDMYRKADALIITLRGNNSVGNTMPGKLQTYMATGKPILGSLNGAANEVISKAKCGACVKADDYIGLATLMREYIDDPQKYSECGENAKAYFKEHFTLRVFTDSLEKELNVFYERRRTHNDI